MYLSQTRPLLFLFTDIYDKLVSSNELKLDAFAIAPTLRAEATFSLCELSCEKQPLPTTVQIRPEIWTNKFKNGFSPVFDRFRALRESCVADQGYSRETRAI